MQGSNPLGLDPAMLMMTLQLHHAQHHIAELDLVPAILGVGLAAGDDEIGTKPVHQGVARPSGD